MVRKLGSLTVGIHVDALSAGFADTLRDLRSRMGTLAAESEIVVVADPLASGDAIALERAFATTLGTRAAFLAHPFDPAHARVLFLDEGIGDVVVLMEGRQDEICALPALLGAIEAGHAIAVTGHRPGPPQGRETRGPSDSPTRLNVIDGHDTA